MKDPNSVQHKTSLGKLETVATKEAEKPRKKGMFGRMFGKSKKKDPNQYEKVPVKEGKHN